jgi:hypothetical protein
LIIPHSVEAIPEFACCGAENFSDEIRAVERYFVLNAWAIWSSSVRILIHC